ncbi:hypothetical protein PUR28_19015 [Streptomyces sp. BE308]|uniref:hypothetical protein n=1 Tax=unclassified Streptomyces TaxID=2593676 RepID=UPI002DD8DABC|nr:MULTISPECIES: hypothetical protein [unclassified Streptomyces]MEE1792821.1 hypothetical protein [Streptomyces sp. BE308]WRZ70377.1 hypothetical protein OG251_01430 [Streptomyces sp. NBC_01237]
MIESWVLDDGSAVQVVLETLRARIGEGQLETWLTSSSGRKLAFVTNAERAMVVLMSGDDDAGEHAVDPGAEGSSGGFVLSNGQYDEYPDADTVPLEEAFRIVDHIVSSGSWPADARWAVDR